MQTFCYGAVGMAAVVLIFAYIWPLLLAGVVWLAYDKAWRDWLIMCVGVLGLMGVLLLWVRRSTPDEEDEHD